MRLLKSARIAVLKSGDPYRWLVAGDAERNGSVKKADYGQRSKALPDRKFPPAYRFEPLFMFRVCREFSIPKSFPGGNSGICAELKRLKLDPYVIDSGACEIEQRLWFESEERRIAEVIKGKS